MYTVKTKQFQGPLDLLLQLTEKEKLDITEVSLAKITDQYLNYLKTTKNISLENLAEFLVIASRLILIKSRMLLPALELTEEEEEDIEELKQRLAEYKRFKNLAKQIETIAKKNKIAYSREKYRGMKTIFYPPKELNLEDLKTSFKKILEEVSLLEEKLPQENLELKISVKEKINYIQNEISKRIKTSFKELTKNKKSKIDIIVNFLALLELIKQKIVTAEQDNLYDDITIKKRA